MFPLEGREDRAVRFVDALTAFLTDEMEPVRREGSRGSSRQRSRYHGYPVGEAFSLCQSAHSLRIAESKVSERHFRFRIQVRSVT